MHETSTDNHAINWSRWLPTPGNIIFMLVAIAVVMMTQQTWARVLPNGISEPMVNATVIPYQGRLNDANGMPLTGTYDINFAIFDAETGGTSQWFEAHPNLEVKDGLFNVRLGSQTEGGVSTNVWDGDRYLQITVNREPLLPREPINAVPIAELALTVPDAALGSRHVNLTSDYIQSTVPNGGLILTNEYQPIPNVEMELNLETPQTLLVIGTIDFRANESMAVGALTLNGVNRRQLMILSSQDNERATVSQTYRLDLPAGRHNLKLQAKLHSGTTGSVWNQTTLGYIAVSQ